ncbi:MAG: hypothetical protein ABIP55_08600, partial [Tepidisphaeraceae bacterium]
WRVALLTVLGSIMLQTTSVRGQQNAPPVAPPPQPAPVAREAGQDERDTAQQMREIVREVTENMREKGMDPQELMLDIRQKMQDGAFDFAELQKDLVAKGVMTDEMVQTLKGSTRRLVAGGIKQRLGATEEEWAVLAPKVQRVTLAMADAGEVAGGGAGGRMGSFMLGGLSGDGAVRKAMTNLRATLQDKNSPDATIAEKLAALREAREKAKVELRAAREDLQSVVTARQEAVLLGMGLL